jgi:hypothetical protein
VDEDDELQVAEWDQAAADTAYREQVGPRTWLHCLAPAHQAGTWHTHRKQHKDL